MTKTVSLNDFIYSKLAVFAGRLSMLAKKPISLGMAVGFSTTVVNELLNRPGVEEYTKKMFSETEILTPEEFDVHWDELFKAITQEKKEQVGKAEADKTS